MGCAYTATLRSVYSITHERNNILIIIQYAFVNAIVKRSINVGYRIHVI